MIFKFIKIVSKILITINLNNILEWNFLGFVYENVL